MSWNSSFDSRYGVFVQPQDQQLQHPSVTQEASNLSKEAVEVILEQHSREWEHYRLNRVICSEITTHSVLCYKAETDLKDVV